MGADAPGNMYIMKEVGGKSTCVNSFKYAKFSADIIHDKKTSKVIKEKFDLDYKSLQKCHADKTKDFEVKIDGTCDKTAKTSTLKITK